MSAQSQAFTVSFTATGSQPLPAGGNGVLAIQSIAWGTGTVKIQGSLDGTNYVDLGILDLTAGTIVAGGTGITATGKAFRVNTSGFPHVQATCSAFTSGPLTLVVVDADAGRGARQ